MELSPAHISLYLYHREENTVFDSLLSKGDIHDVDEDEQVAIYQYAQQFMEAHSYSQYEISNFARDGRVCIHNLNYWYDREYVGVGAGAASFLNGERFTNIPDPELYCKAVQNGKSLVDYSECLDEESYWREAVVLRLRMTNFFSLSSINPQPDAKVVADVRSKLLHCAEAGLVNVRCEDEFCLSNKGLLLANEVMSRVV
jgi:oxygen-independent coproporphyrinogen-3 oxidase